MYVTVRASGACDRSVRVVAEGPVATAASRRRRPAGIGAAAHQRERVGEEQRGAERQHQFAQDLVVEVHRRAPYRRAYGKPEAGLRPKLRSNASTARRPASGVHRSGDPLVAVARRPQHLLVERALLRPRGTTRSRFRGRAAARGPCPARQSSAPGPRRSWPPARGARRTRPPPPRSAAPPTRARAGPSPQRGTRPARPRDCSRSCGRRARPSSHCPTRARATRDRAPRSSPGAARARRRGYA